MERNNCNVALQLEWRASPDQLIMIDIFDIDDYSLIAYYDEYYYIDSKPLYKKNGEIIAKAIKNFVLFSTY